MDARKVTAKLRATVFKNVRQGALIKGMRHSKRIYLNSVGISTHMQGACRKRAGQICTFDRFESETFDQISTSFLKVRVDATKVTANLHAPQMTLPNKPPLKVANQ